VSEPATPQTSHANPCGKPPEPCGEFAALRQANLARAKEWNPTGVDTGPGFAGLELAGEVGELCNLVKKAERSRLGLVGGSVSPVLIAQELADVVICADLVGIELGLDIWPIVVRKFNQTSKEKGFRTRLEDRPLTDMLDLAQQQVEALLHFNRVNEAFRCVVERVGLSPDLVETPEFKAGTCAAEDLRRLGIDTESWTIPGDLMPVSVARFKDAGHPATAAGEAAVEIARLQTQINELERELAARGFGHSKWLVMLNASDDEHAPDWRHEFTADDFLDAVIFAFQAAISGKWFAVDFVLEELTPDKNLEQDPAAPPPTVADSATAQPADLTRQWLLALVNTLHRDAVWHRLSDDTKVVCERIIREANAAAAGGGA
jgi:NTP pyrophosphatase (non-canonical NTP hydrolase)